MIGSWHCNSLFAFSQVVQTSKSEGDNADGQGLHVFKVFSLGLCHQCLCLLNFECRQCVDIKILNHFIVLAIAIP